MESPIELTAETLWTEISARLQGTLNETTYSTWFGEVEGADLADDAFVLGVPNDFTREWIEGHFLGLISAALEDATGRELRIALKVVAAPRERPAGPSPLPAEIETVPAVAAAQVAPRPATTGMNPKYTFDSFVIGSSNRFAHAAALAVAEAPAQAYNPLFIYGGTGLGKTHLLQAIANYVATHTRRDLGALRHQRDVHERLHQLAARQADRGLQAALPHLRRADDRRRAVLRAQGADPGGVLPHLQLALRGRAADRDVAPTGRRARSRRWRSGCARASSGD